ncbi:NAD(P)H-binding protein [Desulfuromonas carbonis]|uniref:complex I NDUFA9 subunit family protein n=1 Tax=Desulfuromonas sp. DDH964 TaxID=1823759 RepID=UPI00078E31EB|nr:complex I NDUFA9 subunit family protein [Desulfuromonas sp. DDH964]AMV73878.1 NAD-dependent nucleoside diphosphate-sugar epimerase/dehydratase [Desulfuromonas sp. DDH964]
MRVFVTGGTGFVGSEVVRQLAAAGHTVRCLVRKGSEGKLAIRQGVEIHHGDVLDPASLERGLAGCQAVIHLVGIIRESPARGVTFERLHHLATSNMVAAAIAAGTKRFLQMSANGTQADASSPYHRTKWAAEEAVRTSTLDWTIFRPSLIFGPGDEFVTMLATLIRRLPVVPVLGNGQYRMSPVAVEDVAAGFVGALKQPQSAGEIYHCCGPEDFSYDEILDLVGAALGKEKVVKLHQPLLLMKPVIALLEGVPGFPITSSQLTMLTEGNVCDPTAWSSCFSIQPLPFAEGIRRYLHP